MTFRLLNNLKSFRQISFSNSLFGIKSINRNSLNSVHRNEFHLTSNDLAEPIRLKMPALSPTMTEGQIVKWHKKEGDKISPGEALFDVQTDKAIMSFELEEEGTIAKILIGEGPQSVQVGSLVAVVTLPGDDWKSVDLSDIQSSTKTEIKPQAEQTAALPVEEHHGHDSGIKIMPGARILLNTYQIDPKTLTNTKSHGFISKSDVKEHIIKNNLQPAPVKQEQVAPAPVETPKKVNEFVAKTSEEHEPDYEDIELSNMRKVIAKRLVLSKTTIPHSYMSANVVVDNIVALRKEMIKNNQKVSLNDFIIKALALSLKLVPELNSNQNNTGDFTQLPNVDISVAVATDKGLITPIIKNADRLSVLGISETVKALADKARQGKLLPHEFQGGSFSISNLGMFGITEFSAVINPPQIGILAVGKSQLKFNTEMKVQTEVTFTLSYDERCCNLDRASKFLNTLNYLIANPQLLVDQVPSF